MLLADRSSRDRYLLASLVDAECMTDPHTRSAIYQAQTNRSTTCNWPFSIRPYGRKGSNRGLVRVSPPVRGA